MILRLIFVLTFAANFSLAAMLPEISEVEDLQLTDTTQSKKKNPFVAGIYSSVWAGGGQYYLGESIRGTLYSLDNVAISALKFSSWSSDSERSTRVSSKIFSLNFFFGYQVYEAYTTAKKDWDQPLVLDVPTYNFKELAASPFQKTSYNTWRVWVPLLLPATGVVSGLSARHPDANLERSLYQIPAIFLASYLIGIGEEALFRGFQQPLFAQATGSKFWGNLIQSVSFGTCHTTWDVCDFPYVSGHITSAIAREQDQSRQRTYLSDDRNLQKFVVTSLYGFYAGSLQQNKAQGLQKAITLHFLWDALVLTSEYLSTGSSVPIFVSFGSDF